MGGRKHSKLNYVRKDFVSRMMSFCSPAHLPYLESLVQMLCLEAREEARIER